MTNEALFLYTDQKMTKPIIVATTNPGKFNQISKVLVSLGINNTQFLSLADLGILNGPVETGSIQDRATQKAQFCLSQIKPLGLANYKFIVANDTGTRLPTLNLDTAESKKIAQEILEGELLQPGDPLNYIYSYTFISLPSQKLYTAQVEVPFTYLGNPQKIKFTEGQNIMNEVKAIPGQTIPHSQVDEIEVIKYRLKYLTPVLKPIIDLL